MARIPYNEEFGGGTSGQKFPTVKLVANQRMRIVTPEEPWSELVHRLEAPQFENGEPKMRMKEGRNGQPATPVYDTEWIGNPICLGDEDVVRANGADVRGCPVCALSVEMAGEGAGPALRRYAMNVVEYTMQPDGKPVLPFNARILIWAFTSRMYDKLLGVKAEHGDLAKVDLILGPVEGPLVFQKFPIAVGASSWARADQNNWNVIQDVWTSPGNRATDDQLQKACGKVAQLQYLGRDLETIRNRYAMARNAGSPVAGGWGGQQPQQGLQEGFNGILGTQPQQAPAGMQPSFQQQAAAGQVFPGMNGVPPQTHPLEQQAAAASASPSPFGAPQTQQAPAPAQPQQPAFTGQGFGEGFGEGFGQQPAPQAQQPAFTDPFGAPQPPAQPQQPFAAVQPQAAPQQPAAPAGNGFGEFAPATTTTPSVPQAQQAFGDTGFGAPAAPQQPQAQPSFAPPAQPAAPQGEQPSFDALLAMGGQPSQGQPGQ